MKFKEYQIVLAAVLLPLFLLWGCQSNKLVSPARVVNMNVSIPTSGLHSKLFDTSYDWVSYNVSGPLSAPVTGMAGPFETEYGSGSVSFSLSHVPVGAGEVLSVELDANTIGGTPEGIGAASLDNVGSGVTVNMGSLARGCYAVYPSSTFTCSGVGGDGGAGQGYFGFDQEYIDYSTPTSPSGYDMEWVALEDISDVCLGTYDLMDGYTGSSKSIAYLGNGQLVNFDMVPTDANFYADGGQAKLAAGAPITTIAYGDIFCVKLQGGTSTGHAWVLFTSQGDASDSPTFVFRVRHDTKPYYLLDQTTTDLNESTSGYANCTVSEEGY